MGNVIRVDFGYRKPSAPKLTPLRTVAERDAECVL